MKSFVTSALCLLAIGCGSTQSTESNLQSSKTAPTEKIADQVVSIEGYITDVNHLMGHPTPTHPGLTKTFVTLEMPVGCLDNFASFSHKVDYKEDKVDIYVAAYSLANRDSIVAICAQVFRGEKRTIDLEGYFAESDINVIWMQSQPVELQVGDTGVYNITYGEIVDLKEICPSNPGGVSCQAEGSQGSVSLALNGCLDRLGNVTYDVKLLADNKAELLISAIGIATEGSTRARCAAMPTAQYDLFTPQGATKETTTLKFLK